MDIVGAFLRTFNPRAALMREHWRREYARLYEAAKLHHQHRRPKAQFSGDYAMDQARERPRDWARWLDENHDLAIGILDTLVNKTIGPGLQVMPMVLDDNGQAMRDLNREISALWRDWIRRPDVTHEHDFASVQRHMARTMFRDGEVLGQHVLGNKGRVVHGGEIPYSIEMIEADFLPFELNVPERQIIHGVEKTAWGRPRAYHVLKKPPENIRSMYIRLDSDDLKRVLAENMIHAKFTRRIGQTRGVTIFHGVAHRLDDIKDYEESERIAARIGASMAAYIQKGTEFDASKYYSEETAGTLKHRTREMQGGQIFDDLLPGETVGTIDVDRPNTSLNDYRNSQMKAAAAGTGTHYSGISRNYDGNYSSQRQELVESRAAYAAFRGYQVFSICQPIYERFITAAILSNRLRVPPQMPIERLYTCGWIAPPEPWIDPAKEAKADELAYKNRFIPWSQIVLQRTGRDPALVLEQIREEQELLAELMPAPTEEAPDDDADDDGDQEDDDEDQAA